MVRGVAFAEPSRVRRVESPRTPVPIEELARRTGVTVRNLRAMQARSLLEPPELVGRKGFYTERHEARVLLVLKLQSRGFSLAAIAALIESWQEGGGILEVMGLENALLPPGAQGHALEADVEKAFPELLAEPRALAKALAQELVIEKDGRYVAPDAELLGIVKQQVAAGFPLEALLDDGDALLADLERIATRFRKSFFAHLIDPHFAHGAPQTALPDLAAKVELLRPLAVRLVGILLARAIERGGGPNAEPVATRRSARSRKKVKRANVKPKRKR